MHFLENSSYTALQMISGCNLSLLYSRCRLTPFEKIWSKNKCISWKILHIQHYKWFLAVIWVYCTQGVVWHHLRKFGVKINAFLGKFFTYSNTNEFWLKSEVVVLKCKKIWNTSSLFSCMSWLLCYGSVL